MKYIKLFFTLIPLITICSCREYKIMDAGYDSNINFSNYKSFSWLPVNDTANNPYDNSKFRNALMKDFTKQMIKRKYILQPDTADFYLDLIVSNCKQTRLEDSLVPTVQLYMYHTSKSYVPPPRKYVSKTVHYIEDYVTINMVDRKTNQLILSVTSEADIDLGDVIPNSPNCVSKGLFKKFLKLQKESLGSNL